jgi:hypothetical protein
MSKKHLPPGVNVELSQETLDWLQSLTDGHKRIYEDEELRKSIDARNYSVPVRRPHVDFDIEPSFSKDV